MYWKTFCHFTWVTIIFKPLSLLSRHDFFVSMSWLVWKSNRKEEEVRLYVTDSQFWVIAIFLENFCVIWCESIVWSERISNFMSFKFSTTSRFQYMNTWCENHTTDKHSLQYGIENDWRNVPKNKFYTKRTTFNYKNSCFNSFFLSLLTSEKIFLAF